MKITFSMILLLLFGCFASVAQAFDGSVVKKDGVAIESIKAVSFHQFDVDHIDSVEHGVVSDNGQIISNEFYDPLGAIATTNDRLYTFGEYDVAILCHKGGRSLYRFGRRA